MRRAVVGVVCVGFVCAVFVGGVQGQVPPVPPPPGVKAAVAVPPQPAAGDLGSLEQQRADVDKEIKAAEQKKEERRKALAEKADVADAKKAADASVAAFQEFVKNNADYAKVSTARADAGAAYGKAMADARTADKQFGDLKKKSDEVKAKVGEVDKKIRDAGSPSAELAKEKADLEKEIASNREQRKEREKALSEQGPVADAKKAADAADAAFQEFVKNNADYGKVSKAQADASAAYSKALEAAKSGDADYTALRKTVDEARAKRSDLDKKIAALKPRAEPKK